MAPKVSVVMASYNHAKFVRVAIESVLAQSFADFELVITDDGSRDATAEVIRSISDPRIRFHVFEENRGACDALNDAISRSTGAYISVLNSDDYFLPEKLARQVAYLDANASTGAVFGMPQIIDEMGHDLSGSGHVFTKVFTDVNRTRIDWLRYFFEFGNCLCHPTLMLRRTCYDEVGLYDPLLMNLPDFDMWVRLCRSFDIHVMSDRLTAFRILDQERNTSSPSGPNMARVAWETSTVLAHFAALPEAELKDLVRTWPENASQASPLVVLALVALRIDRPGYCQFGLGLLRQCIGSSRASFPIREYFRLVGDLDPNGARFGQANRFFQDRSTCFARIRRLLGRTRTWWRTND